MCFLFFPALGACNRLEGQILKVSIFSQKKIISAEKNLCDQGMKMAICSKEFCAPLRPYSFDPKIKGVEEDFDL